MIQWKIFSSGPDGAEGKADWEALLGRFADASPFQSWGWGELKSAAGWKPIRVAALNGNGEPALAAQILSKSLPGKLLRVFWIPGGPLLQGTVSQGKEWHEALSGFNPFLRERFGRYFLRMNSLTSNQSALSCSLASEFHRPFARVISGFTLFHSLEPDGETLEKQMTSKHRYYVKAARKAGLEWRYADQGESLGELWTLLEEVEQSKGSFKVGLSRREIDSLPRYLPGKFGVLLGQRQGKPITGCLVLHTGKSAFYLLAATNHEGREVSAAYGMVPQLWDELKKLGIERFDFGGIAPGNAAAKGVDHFKRGFGGRITEYLGEWESSSPSFSRYFVNPMIYWRLASA